MSSCFDTRACCAMSCTRTHRTPLPAWKWFELCISCAWERVVWIVWWFDYRRRFWVVRKDKECTQDDNFWVLISLAIKSGNEQHGTYICRLISLRLLSRWTASISALIMVYVCEANLRLNVYQINGFEYYWLRVRTWMSLGMVSISSHEQAVKSCQVSS